MYYSQLGIQEKSLVEQQVTNNQKNTLIAYVLWFFAGMTGAHRFYTKGATTSAIIQLVTFILGFLTTFLLIGFIILFFLGIWVLIDAFLIPKMIREESDELRERFARDLLAHNNSYRSDFRSEDLDMDF